ncbi:hypothetical protein ESY86_07245 [Subsaximicrobium wynnwilliamsii]|jgi:hypothetical protein|uniref:Uncharacterized protein n=1 Tax=Subsaximicrobium wynnwilliamsii TaxID=291179 RepID=A0A5C6ZLM3_9FLAO|nr:hypothetical protein [Subsaximicrobium wynnwilliamsii]TXD83833.1 hypothetical protein ESY87_07405 [Subsaximicrobium wynnwilliamsii]TXD89574.1 hypothetical protein ESY86_07245 [Subsaximicrobium wynnwilliamsii]TXE02635.1 hypothetical protein ESY88_11600 [Subsaximicrobium wynnwilliamsii]
MKTIKIPLLALFLLNALFIFAQQSKQNINMKIDSIGNAKVTISMTMNASQWQQWNGSYGNNPSALKREIERGMPAFFVDDFKLDKDDMNRSFALSLNAYGACRIDKRGKWIMNTDQKDAQLTALTKHKYMLVSSPPEYGGSLQQIYTIELPEAAHQIKTDKDAFGKSTFEFKMDQPSGPFNYMRWSGVFLIVIGGAWFGKNAVTRK